MKYINKILLLLVLIAFILMSYSRGVLVDGRLSVLKGCGGCYQTWVWESDMWLFLIMLFLLFCGACFKKYVLRLGFRAVAIALLVICWLDFYIFKTLTSRVYFSDIGQYFDANAMLEFWRNETGSYAVLVALFMVFVLGWFLFVHKQIKLQKSFLIVSAVVVNFTWVMLFSQSKEIKYVHDVLVRNLASINLNTGESVEYSEAFTKALVSNSENLEELTCNSNGLGRKNNVILVVVESLSAYHSKKLSGLNDWTPHLDKLSDQYMWFDNFFANNFNSLMGRLALINGEKTFREVVSIMNQGRRGYRNSQRNLAQLFNQQGYHTAFLDGADLNFTDTGDYMNDIGFQFVEGHESAFYEGEERYAFQSVADDVLYRRVLDYKKDLDQPYFITVITVTTHQPYIDPVSKEMDISKAVQFADQTLYDFYLKLESQNYFENGILLVTSDHRAMMPMFDSEIDRLGNHAFSKIPMVVIGKAFEGRGKQSDYVQQSDLLNSLEYLTSKQHCARKDEGNLFSEPVKAADCVYHSRGDYRDRIDVFCENGSQYGQVQLKGDDTRLIAGELTDEESIIQFINASRIAAQQRESAFQNDAAKQND